MMQRGDGGTIEQEIERIKALVERHRHGAAPVSEAVTDLAKALHDVSDHLEDLHRRLEKIESTQEEWSTRGWLPPPGSDSPS